MAVEAYIGEIMLVGFNFAPQGWTFCNGQILPIAQNSALFSLLGTNFGGDGRTTFALPDLRGRVPVGAGQGPGLSNVRLGEQKGAETTTLNVGNLPQHSHAATAQATLRRGTSGNPKDRVWAVESEDSTLIYTDGSPDVSMAGGAVVVGNTGGGQAFNNWQPSLGMHWIIALQGAFPPRD